MKILCTGKIEVTKRFFFLKYSQKRSWSVMSFVALILFLPHAICFSVIRLGWELRNSQGLAVPRWGKETRSLFIVWLERVVMFQV